MSQVQNALCICGQKYIIQDGQATGHNIDECIAFCARVVEATVHTTTCRHGTIVYLDGKPEYEWVCTLPKGHKGHHQEGRYGWE